VSNATQTKLDAVTNFSQSYVMFNNTIPGFANSNVSFMVNGVKYATNMANSTGFMSFNYTGHMSTLTTFEFQGIFVPEDVNQDGEIDLQDLIFMNIKINTNSTCDTCDVNKNGFVDIYDIILVSGKIT